MQFDFPDENGRPYKSSGGKMVWNDRLKREIPEGWKDKQLSDLLSKIESGKRPNGGIDKQLKDGIPSLGAENIDEIGVFDYAKTAYLPFEYKSMITTGIIQNKDIAIYKDGAYVGKTTIFQNNFPFEFACVNEHVFLIHVKQENMSEYLLFTLKQPTYFNLMQNLGKAKAAQPGLNQNDLKNIVIIEPQRKVLQLFHAKISVILDNIFNHAKEISSLTKQRNELLPLLMNGQITIE